VRGVEFEALVDGPETQAKEDGRDQSDQPE